MYRRSEKKTCASQLLGVDLEVLEVDGAPSGFRVLGLIEVKRAWVWAWEFRDNSILVRGICTGPDLQALLAL